VSTESNKEVVRKSVASFNEGNLAGYLELVDESYTHHDASQPDGTNREAVSQLLQGVMVAFPDGQVTIDDLIAEDDKVVKRYTARGTHTGEFAGVPATGRPVTFTGVTVYRIENGKFTEGWWHLDLASILGQIGAMPQPA
jgi:steroid delta-isomerase-like uncharacterized protein